MADSPSRSFRTRFLSAAAFCVAAVALAGPAFGFTRPGTPPEPNTTDDALVTKFVYNTAGYQEDTIDNAGKTTRQEHDALGRVTAVIENYVDGTAGGTTSPDNDDEDRITRYVYNAAGQVIEQTADLPTGQDDQTTHYIYSDELATGSEGSPVPSNSLLRATLYPDSVEDGETRASVITDLNTTSGGGGDFVEMAYLADGSLHTRVDQRSVKLTYAYDNAGRRTSQTVSVVGGGVLPGGDLHVAYAYTDLGQLESATTFDTAAGTLGSETSEVGYTYNGLQQLATEEQDHKISGGYPGSGPLAGTPTLSYGYDDSATSNAFNVGHRLDTVTYPNARTLHVLYSAPTSGPGGLPGEFSRASGLAEDNGSGGVGDTIVHYSRLGNGLTAIKDLPGATFRLDHTDVVAGDPTDSYPGWDRFGRQARLRWDRYNDQTGVSTNSPITDFRHAYDRASNRLYSHDKVYVNSSDLYAHDNLHRLSRFDRGNLNGTQDAMALLTHAQNWELDALGNWVGFQQDDDGGTASSDPWDLEQDRTHNNANEITEITGTSPGGTTGPYDQSADANGNVVIELEHYDNQNIPASPNDHSWVVGQHRSDTPYLKTNSTNYWSSPPAASATATFTINIPTGEGGDYIIWGLVKGGNSSNDSFWVNMDSNGWFSWNGISNTSTDVHWNDIHDSGNGGATKVFNLTAGSHTLEIGWRERFVWFDKIYITKDGDHPLDHHIDFTAPGITLEAEDASLGADWNVTNQNDLVVASNGKAMQALPDDDDNLGNTGYDTAGPRLDYEVDFDTAGTYRVWVRARGVNGPNSDFSETFHVGLDGNTNSGSEEMESYFSNSFSFRSKYTGSGNPTIVIPSAGTYTINLWMRQDGVIVDKMFLSTNQSTWPGGSPWGELGPDETPRIAGSGGGTQQLPDPEHDDAGNVTRFHRVGTTGGDDWTATLVAEYDAWNRLITVKDDSDSQNILTLATLRYDAMGRRIERAVTNTPNSGATDFTYHYYYDGQSLIETRNGSNLVIKQHVWGSTGNAGDYIDELIQVAINDDPTDTGEQDTESNFLATHNAQFNVIALIAATTGSSGSVLPGASIGDIVERYEYTPYGQRTVFVPATLGDTLADQPADDSQWLSSTGGASGPLNELGHQGLHHDAESGLIYNRRRILNPSIGRFLQADPLGYVDGASLYSAYAILHGFVDPLGLEFRAGRRYPDFGEDRGGGIPGLTPQGPVEAIQRALGMILGLGAFDFNDQENPIDIIEEGECCYLITVNGINGDYSQRMLDEIRERLDEYADWPGSAARNNTSGIALDLYQVMLSETGLIEQGAHRVARHIAQAHNAMIANGCCNPRIHVVAHSQGAGLARRAADSMLDDEILEHVTFETWGAEQMIPGFPNLVNNARHTFPDGRIQDGDFVPRLSKWNTEFPLLGGPWRFPEDVFEIDVLTQRSRQEGGLVPHNWDNYLEWRETNGFNFPEFQGCE